MRCGNLREVSVAWGRQTLFSVRMDTVIRSRLCCGGSRSLPTPFSSGVRGLMRSDIPRAHPSFRRACSLPRSESDAVRCEHPRLYNDFFTCPLPFTVRGPWTRPRTRRRCRDRLDHAINESFRRREQRRRPRASRQPKLQCRGVLAPWRPSVKFYDMTQSTSRARVDLHCPRVTPRAAQHLGNSAGGGVGRRRVRSAPAFRACCCSRVELPRRRSRPRS